MVTAILGARIRERRRQIGLTQVELARRAGISGSYLNLIERNRRGIAGALLHRIASELGLRVEDLDGAAEQRLLDTLRDAAGQPHLARLGIEEDSATELLGRYPGWARAFVAVMRSERRASDLARSLSDRLRHDPYLGETVHQMLTRISAVRSAAEIQSEVPDLTADQRARFDQIIHAESRELSLVGEALAQYFDKVEEPEQALTPQDEVEAFFDAHRNRFAAIEAMVQAGGDPDGPEIAACVAELTADQSRLQTASARDRAATALREYAALAAELPLGPLRDLAKEHRFDLQRMADASGRPFPVLCKRLTALPPGDGVPLFGYLCANASGNILDLRAHPTLPIPRHTGACPLWILFRAQQRPGEVVRQLIALPTGPRFVFVAVARPHGTTGFGQPVHYQTDMLVLTEADAASTVYGTRPDEQGEAVGTACRICPHTGCAHRVSDPFS